jgi:hypothetical protein
MGDGSAGGFGHARRREEVIKITNAISQEAAFHRPSEMKYIRLTLKKLNKPAPPGETERKVRKDAI